MIADGSFPRGRTSSPAIGRLARAFVVAVVIVGALFNGVVGALSLLAPGAFLAAVGQAEEVVAPSALVFAEYAGAREVAIAAALIVCAAWRLWPALAGVLIVAAAANAVDAVGALAAGRWVQLPGAVAFAAVYALAATWCARQPAQSADSPSRLA